MSAGAFLPPFLVVLVTTAALAQWPLPGWLLDQLRPIARSYEHCATEHMRARAAADPFLSFEAQEGSIRGACGTFVEQARNTLSAAGYERARADSEINAAYLQIQPRLRDAYRKKVAEESRNAALRAADASHRACLSGALGDLVLNSAEGAETLATAVMAGCLDHENRRIAMVGALFGVPRLDARRALEQTFENLRRELVRDIVTSQRRAPTAPPPAKSPEPGPSVTSGTAFFVGREGQLLTNNHVVRECKTILVTSNAGNPVAGTVYARDATNALALVKTDLKQIRQAAWRQGARLGEAVAAFGYPFATVLASSGNFTVGHITALSGLGDDSRFIQIQPPFSPATVEDRCSIIAAILLVSSLANSTK